jgi:hypothetical protein
LNDNELDVHALVDGELTAEQKAEAERHVASDAQAQVEYRWVVCIKQLLSCKCRKVEDEECWTKAMKQIAAMDRTKGADRFVEKYAWSFCAIFVIAIATAAFYGPSRTGADLTSGEMASLFTELKPMEGSARPDSVSDLLRSRVGTSPSGLDETMLVIDEVATGMIQGKKAARVTCSDAIGNLMLFVIEDTRAVEGLENPAASGMMTGRLNDLPCVSWREGRFIVILAGDRQIRDLMSTADSMRGL